VETKTPTSWMPLRYAKTYQQLISKLTIPLRQCGALGHYTLKRPPIFKYLNSKCTSINWQRQIRFSQKYS